MKGVNRENAGDKLGKVLLQLNKVAVVEGSNGSFQYLGRNEFADVSSDGRGRGKFGNEAAENFDYHEACAGVTHPEDMSREEYYRFKDRGLLKDKGAGCMSMAVSFCTTTRLNLVI